MPLLRPGWFTWAPGIIALGPSGPPRFPCLSRVTPPTPRGPPFSSLLSFRSPPRGLLLTAVRRPRTLTYTLCAREKVRTAVQPCILGRSSAPDSSAFEVCDRSLRFLRQIVTRTHTHVSDILAYADTDSLTGVRHLAVAAHQARMSEERRMRWPKSFHLNNIHTVCVLCL